jgi:hypothetical protein
VGNTIQRGALGSALLTKYQSGDKSKARSGAYRGYLRERVQLEDPGIDERVIVKWIFEKWVGGMDGIDLVEDRER